MLQYDSVFANDIRKGAVPTDFQSVLALSDNMGPLSLYQYEAHSSYLHARQSKTDRAVPVLGPSGLLAQIGCNDVKSCLPRGFSTPEQVEGVQALTSRYRRCRNGTTRTVTETCTEYVSLVAQMLADFRSDHP